MRGRRATKRGIFLLLTILLLLVPVTALAQSGGGYEILYGSVDGGGTTSQTAGGYTLSGTAGQPDAGILAAGAYTLGGGFWAGGIGTPDVEGYWVYLPVVLRGQD